MSEYWTWPRGGLILVVCSVSPPGVLRPRPGGSGCGWQGKLGLALFLFVSLEPGRQVLEVGGGV